MSSVNLKTPQQLDTVAGQDVVAILEELGIKYYGPINGHAYNEMLMYLDMAKKEKQSLILHVITEKGKGYEYALNDKVGT